MYAKWSPENQTSVYNITYNLNGGTQALGQITSFTYSDLPITLLDPTRTNYRFDGWYEDPLFSGSKITQITTSGDKTFYAKWIELYSITYNLNGGTQATNQVTSFISGDNLTILDPTRGGFQFDGWFDNSSYSGNAITSTASLSGSTTLYAKWTQTVDYVVETTGNSVTLTTNQISSTNTVSIRDYINMEFNGVNNTNRRITRIDVTLTYTTQGGQEKRINCILQSSGGTNQTQVISVRAKSTSATTSFTGLNIDPNETFTITNTENFFHNNSMTIRNQSITVYLSN